MQLNEALDIYDELYLKVFAVSATLFLLYSVINLIEMNKYIIDFNILNVAETPRGRFIYSYLAGYFMFVLKVILALVTLFILLLIIRVAVAALIFVFIAKDKKNQELIKDILDNGAVQRYLFGSLAEMSLIRELMLDKIMKDKLNTPEDYQTYDIIKESLKEYVLFCVLLNDKVRAK